MKKCLLCEAILPDYYRVCPSKPNGVQCKGKLVKHQTTTQQQNKNEEEKKDASLFDAMAVNGDIDDFGGM